MRLASVIGDVHLGNHHVGNPRIGGEMRSGLNERCREIAKALAITGQKSSANLVVAGDLFDAHDPTPEVVAAAMGALRSDAHVIVGNHDQTSWDTLHHALAPLCRQFNVYERPAVVDFGRGYFAIMVPFRNKPGPEHLRESLDSLDLPESASRILLVTHMGIEDGKTPPWLQGSRNSIGLSELSEVLDQYSIDDCAAGDWHGHRLWKLGGHSITQIGALCPTGWDNPGLDGYGSLVHWHDDGRFEREEIPGPRFLDGDGPKAPEGYTYYRRYTVQTVEEASQYREQGTSVVFDRKATAEKNERAAASVRNTSKIEERIQAYCEEQFGDRADKITALVLECIKESRGNTT